jgi:hypothetical protein
MARSIRRRICAALAVVLLWLVTVGSGAAFAWQSDNPWGGLRYGYWSGWGEWCAYVDQHLLVPGIFSDSWTQYLVNTSLGGGSCFGNAWYTRLNTYNATFMQNPNHSTDWDLCGYSDQVNGNAWQLTAANGQGQFGCTWSGHGDHPYLLMYEYLAAYGPTGWQDFGYPENSLCNLYLDNYYWNGWSDWSLCSP